MSTIIQLRGDTSANWTAANPILAERELAIETDTYFYKIGDGITTWNSLPYRYLKLIDDAEVINFENQISIPSVPGSDSLNLFARSLGGRMMLRQQGPSGLSTPLQPSFFQNNIVIINTNASSTITSIGNTVTSVGTISHPAVTNAYGFMANFVTAATALATSGTGNATLLWQRGATSGANGFFFNARLSFPDISYEQTTASTGSRIFVGLTNGTMAASVASDDPAGHFAGFFRRSVNGASIDTHWQFATKDNVTIDVNSTGLTFSAEKVYDFYIFCAPQGTEISWRIDNVTDGTMAEGSTTTRLPDNTTNMRAGFQLQTVNALARNIRMQRVYIESDR
jgi:hypothetical protein